MAVFVWRLERGEETPHKMGRTGEVVSTGTPRLLDLFCGAGGAATGYARAGFDVVGVDINPQPRYPFEFHQADALTFPLNGFDVIHASPPCQGYARTRHIVSCNRYDYPLLIEPMRARLSASGLPWVLENVEGAPMLNPLQLCGTMFGLLLRRHRWFDSSVPLFAAGVCRHSAHDLGVYAGKVTRLGTHATAYVASSGRTHYRPQLATQAEGRAAMGIHWMRPDELSEAIPPAYTEWLGRQLLVVLDTGKVARDDERRTTTDERRAAVGTT